ncbi:MAG: twin-arginine translocation signal domain-containing protein, partial [Anaerolineae bacterium]|nr:twin-arginine translocation signal domain-containing protein [Anaerolineae bacterium]
MAPEQKKTRSLSRRQFLQRTGSGAVGMGLLATGTPLWAATGPVAPSDRIRIGILGFGVRGRQLALALARVGGA